MCGIFMSLRRSDSSEEDRLANDYQVQNILNRGPNLSGNLYIHELDFHASVLHIQGAEITSQPLTLLDGSVFLWNGEVFGGDIKIENGRSDTDTIAEIINNITSSDNDQNIIGNKLVTLLSTIWGPYAFIYYHHPSNNLFFGRDPFGRRSLILLRDETNILSIGSVQVDLSPTEENLQWEELDTQGLYSLSIDTDSERRQYKLDDMKRHYWPANRIRLSRSLPLKDESSVCSTTVVDRSDELLSVMLNAVSRRVSSMISFPALELQHEVRQKTTDVVSSDPPCRVGVLFSGGIDSVFLAVLLHLVLESRPDEPIELINVTFLRNCRSEKSVQDSEKQETPAPDRLAAVAALLEIQGLYPSRDWRLVHVDVTEEERNTHETHVKNLIKPCDTHMDLNIGTAFWFAARGQGYLRSYKSKKFEDFYQHTDDNHNKSRGDFRPILRHGGEGADLSTGLNPERLKIREQRQFVRNIVRKRNGVCLEEGQLEDSFESSLKGTGLSCSVENCGRVAKPGCFKKACKKCCDYQHRVESGNDVLEVEVVSINNCPVHKPSSKQLMKMERNLENMKKKLEESKIKTEIINSSSIDIEHTEKEYIEPKSLTPEIKPTESTLNNTINPESEAEKISYHCRCKVLLVGIGADEQLAGYGRHRSTFLGRRAPSDSSGGLSTEGEGWDQSDMGGWRGLAAELNMDMTRLWKRNLGRDDRCVSDNGREPWFPFLDEEVVGFIQNLSLSEIVDFSLPQGVGDKKILREAAKRVGLTQCTSLVKRAIQFGTRVAKHTNERYHGSNRKGKGETKI